MKRLLFCVVLFACAIAIGQNNANEQLLKQIEHQLNRKEIRPNHILGNSKYDALRNAPEDRIKLRQILKKFPEPYSLIMTSAEEPGEKLILFGKVNNVQPSTVIYIFHTDNSGLYAPEHERPGYGSNNPRLFGYVSPDVNGEFKISTIVPACYPGGSLKHIHYEIVNGNQRRGGELIFDEEPNPPSERQRSWAKSVGFKIVKRTWSKAEGSFIVNAEF